MTTDLEKQFFDTFGIEPERSIGLIKIKEPSYPSITASMLLELLRIVMNNDFIIQAETVDKLKEDLLTILIDNKEEFNNKVRILFKEDNGELQSI